MSKNIRSDCGGKYYGRYDGLGEQCLGPFAKFLKECSIVPQYTMPGSPSMNGVAKRRNLTIKDMVLIPIIDQDGNPEPQQDNVEELSIQDEVIIPEEQPQQPQKQMPLRRSTREMRNVIPDDYVVFLQEHENDNGMIEDDPINFHQVMKSSNSQKWIDAMKDEYKSIQYNKVWELVPLLEGAKPIGCK
ncbi:uncharacterized protein LOC108468654 [Gossypium arboreum]|uniref:uncharacterized protein LOC108468654 n=1 Tax=Gossypium arboreum TaxID=29729 RepID=UPI00081906B4|nr:uncharacterized protein LOC108468654 [Gossypium arboreum]